MSLQPPLMSKSRAHWVEQLKIENKRASFS
jgi:hypothetical protein